LHLFPEQKLINIEQNYCLILFNILRVKGFYRGNFDLSFHHKALNNQKILSTARKQIHFHHVFRNAIFM